MATKIELILNREQLEILRQLGIVDEVGLRDYWIRKEIDRRHALGEKKGKVILEIAEVMFMEPQRVHEIYYKKKENKKNRYLDIEEI
jgi:hypothetical protein